MELRYKVLFSLPGDQYAPGAPVIIREAAQLLDQLTGRVYVRIHLHGIESLAEAVVEVLWQDGETQSLTCQSDEPQQILALCREPRSFVLQIRQILLTDGTVWWGEDVAWQPLPERTAMEEVLDPEEAAQYREDYGAGCKWVPQTVGDLFLCACGAMGKAQPCGACGKTTPLIDARVLQTLGEEIDARRAEEERQREEKRKQKEEARRQKRQRYIRVFKRLCIGLAVLVGVLGVAAAVFWYVTRRVIPESHYQRALTALKQENYREAHRQFTLAGDHKDAEEYLARFSTPEITFRNENYPAEKDPSGSFVEDTYDAQGRLVMSVATALAPNEQGELEETEQTYLTIREYDEEGRLLRQMNEWGETKSYIYDHMGSEVKYEHVDEDGTLLVGITTEYAYDAAGRVVHERGITTDVHGGNFVHETDYLYHGNGQLLKEQTEGWDLDTPEDRSRSTKTWTYNEDGQILEYTYVWISAGDKGESERTTQVYTYQSNGSLLEERTESHFVLDDDTAFTETGQATYDTEGRKLRTVSVTDYLDGEDDDWETEQIWEYDEQGRVTLEKKQERYAEGIRESSVRREYNRRGDLVRKVTTKVSAEQQGAEDQTVTETWSYDWEGKLVETLNETFFPNKGTDGRWGTRTTETYTYDLFGRVVECREWVRYPERPLRSGVVTTTTYTYRTDGTLAQSEERMRDRERPQNDQTTVTTYNANGLAETVRERSGNSETYREYTYAYFYYPEGTEITDQTPW